MIDTVVVTPIIQLLFPLLLDAGTVLLLGLLSLLLLASTGSFFSSLQVLQVDVDRFSALQTSAPSTSVQQLPGNVHLCLVGTVGRGGGLGD
eukprot:CAMPEP_0173178358 /NCGR_PEP_ID=MMETSP1141-20130122/5490_1 /TAXON_ID=483371 /ORGANISM="non described non described, Strain CCMP2298" /LENGTH=90 /DNA_ID=CAMNT_0014100837 /DNA_START=265 /DNA_END=537 /DNA_ORIENTATION=+